MKQVAILSLLVLLCTTAHVHGQVVLPDKGQPAAQEHIFGLGLAGGPVSGIGLSFRHHFPGAASYQLTGGVVKADDRVSYAVGAELQFDLSRGTGWRFFAVAGAGYYYSGTTGENEMEGPGRAGLGIGGEMSIGVGLHGSAELLFSYFTDGTILPLPQVGIHYYFF
jgi:hypothetical protein